MTKKMHLIILLAWRYLKNINNKALNKLITISFVSIVLSSGILLLVMSIMNGFETSLYRQIKGLHPDLIINSTPSTSLDINKLTTLFNTQFPYCTISPSSSAYVIIASKTQTAVVLLKAIDPIKENLINQLENYIISPIGVSLDRALTKGQIIIGEKLAQLLDASYKNPLTIIYKPYNPYHAISFEQETTYLGGVFKTGSEEFDSYIAYCSFDLMNSLFPELGITQLNVTLPPETGDPIALKESIQESCNIPVCLWEDLYPSLQNMLILEKYSLNIILSLIIFMAMLNISAVLTVLIKDKRQDIAILKTLGLSNKYIKKIFLLISLIISITACLIGLLVGGIFGLLLQRYPLVQLPDTYIVNYLPINFNIDFFYFIFFYIVGISLIISYFSIRKATDNPVSKAFQFKD